MKLKQYLKEDYYGRYQSNLRKESFEVFVNPTRKEMKRLGDMRVFIDADKKKIYIWDVNAEIHPFIKQKLNIDDDKALPVTAEYRNTKMNILYSDLVVYDNKKFIKIIKNNDFSWAYDYFSNLKELIDSNRHKFLQEKYIGSQQGRNPWDKDKYFEIFKNPSYQEMKNLDRLRWLAKPTGDLYVWKVDLLHKYVKVDGNNLLDIHNDLLGSGIVLNKKIVNDTMTTIPDKYWGNKEAIKTFDFLKKYLDNTSFAEIKNRFTRSPVRNLTKDELDKLLQEEHYKYIIPKYSRAKESTEVFENPTLSELKEIDKQYRKNYYQYMIGNNKSAKNAKIIIDKLTITIRFIFFPFENTDFPTNKWYAASADLIHEEFGCGGMSVAIRAAGCVVDNKVNITVFGYEKDVKIVESIMKKTGMRYQIV
jgi:hypothetical protein